MHQRRFAQLPSNLVYCPIDSLHFVIRIALLKACWFARSTRVRFRPENCCESQIP